MKWLILVIAVVTVLTTATSGYAAQPYLIEYSAGGSHNFVTEAVAHRTFIDTLPFDGMVMKAALTSSYLMSTNFSVGSRSGRQGIQDGVWTYQQCLDSFSPLANSTGNRVTDKFSNVAHNFVFVQFRVNAGLFSDTDWDWILESFTNFAHAAKDLGFEGIMIDNELYDNTSPGYWNYYDTNGSSVNHLYFTGYTMTECHLQARLRGKQVMDAIISEFPAAPVIVLHGPYRSSWVSNAAINSNQNPNPPSLLNHCLGLYTVDEMLEGAFVSGLIESSGLQTGTPHSKAVDGGELYDFHDLATFKDNYEWRKYGILNTAIGDTIYPTHPVKFLDTNLRSTWSTSNSVSYGLYDYKRDYNSQNRTFGSWYAQTNMTNVRNDVANAMRIADDYVWHYTEGFDWFADPENPEGQTPASEAWIDAISLGMADAAVDTTNPTVAITGPTSNSTYSSTQTTINLSGTVSDNYYVKSVGWAIQGGSSGNCVLGAAGTWSVSNVPLSVGPNNITVTVTDKIGNTSTDTLAVSTPPGTPTIGTATAGNGQASVAYTAPSSNGGSTITSYTATSTPGNFTGTVSQSGSGSITVTGLTNGTAYTFKVKATNSIGTGSESGASNSVTPAAAPTVPGAPTIGTATAGDGQATVSYTAPASNGGSTITSYTATSTPGSITGTISQSGSGSITVTGLTNGTAYTFKVKATNAVGTGSESAASNSVTPAASGSSALAEFNFNSDHYTANSPTGHWRYSASGGSLVSTAYSDVNRAPDTLTGPIQNGANWQQVTGVSGTAPNWYSGYPAQFNLYTGTGSESDTFTNWFTSSRQTLTISAKIKFNKLRAYTTSVNFDLNHIFTIGIGQSGNTSQNLFHINAAIDVQRYAGGGTNRGGIGDTHNLSNYVAESTFGNNSAVTSNRSNTGTLESVEANWRAWAGLTLQRNAAGDYDPRMTKFAERGSIGTATPAVTGDPNAVPIAVAGPDGTAGNADDWYQYTMTIDFSAGDTATYKVYIGDKLQATLVQTLPTGKSGSDYWTIRELEIGPYQYFSGAIDDLKITGTIDDPSALAEFNFDSDHYTANSPTGHWRYSASDGSLVSTAYSDVTRAPDTLTGPIQDGANWQQVTGVSGTAPNWYSGNSAQFNLYTGTGSESTTFTNWFTSSRQTLTISAKIKFNKLRANTTTVNYDLNHIYTIGIGQSGDTSQNLFNINAAIDVQRYAGGGTNRGGMGDTHNLSNYLAETTFGTNSAVTTNRSNTGNLESVEANWRAWAGLTLQRNTNSYDPRMSKFAERGSIGTATPAVTGDPNAVAIAVAGPDGTAGNADDWYQYTMTIDFSAGDTATYNVYIGNTLQATLTQTLPTGKDGSDYWTIREFKLGPNQYFSGAIDDLKITGTIDIPT